MSRTSARPNTEPEGASTAGQAPPQTAATPAAASRHRPPIGDIALISVFAAFIAVCAIVPGFAVGPVPITLQTLAVVLAGAVLGSLRGFLAVLLYLAVGAIGLPVFSGGGAGLAPFAGPSVGYLVSFPLAAWLIGFIVERLPRRRLASSAGLLFIAVLAGNLVFIWPLGILGMWWRVPFDTIEQAFSANLVFVPGDLIKVAVAALIASSVHRAFPTLLSSSAKVRTPTSDRVP